MKVHVCLVSAQAAANLLPALDPELKPDHLVLVVTEKMRRQADNLEKVLKENGIAVQQMLLENEADFHRVEEQLLELAGGLVNDEVFLNITGGTKLMSVAAQSVAAASDWRMFYVDADSDHVIWLGRNASAPHTLPQQLRLRHYLKSYGFNLEDRPKHSAATQDQKRLLHTLTREIGSLQDALGTLNYLAQTAEGKRSLSIDLDEQQLDSRSLEALIRHFADANALSLQGKTLRFASEADRDFVKGGWLEMYAMQTIQEVSDDLKIRDKAIGLEVVDDLAGTRNELDIAFMARNRLFVIECKTARIDRPQGRSDTPAPAKANDTLFKLAENCRRIGGLGTRGMLLSYRRLNDPEKSLARALNIEVVSGGDVQRLPELVKRWVRPAA